LVISFTNVIPRNVRWRKPRASACPRLTYDKRRGAVALSGALAVEVLRRSKHRLAKEVPGQHENNKGTIYRHGGSKKPAFGNRTGLHAWAINGDSQATNNKD